MKKKYLLRSIGVAFIVVGGLLATNGLVAGPHAFGTHWWGVGVLVVSGLIVVGLGIALIQKRISG
jgi:hypothetical protein